MSDIRPEDLREAIRQRQELFVALIENPGGVLQCALTEDCEACEGRGWNIFDSGWAGFECEDCTNGRVLRKGVERIWWCDFQQAAYPACRLNGAPSEHQKCGGRYLLPESVVEGGTDV